MMSDKAQNVQDVFLNHVRKNKTPVTVFLVNGVKLQGIITWFDNFCVLLRRDAHSDKPHCAPVELALKPSGIAPGPEVWLLGDTAVDMECALASGCVPVLFGETDGSAEFAQFPPMLTIADDAGLFRALRGL